MKHWLTQLTEKASAGSRSGLLGLLLIALFSFPASLMAGGKTGMVPYSFPVPIHKSKTMSLANAAERVSVGNPAIADILLINPKELYILGRQLGSTNIMVWDNQDRLVDIVDIEITHDLNGLKEKLHRFLPDEPIEVHSSQGQLVIGGQVSNLDRMNMALDLAHGYAVAANNSDNTSTVLNLMSVGGGHQVMLEVTVTEVQRELARTLDSDFALVFEGSDFIGGLLGGDGLISNKGIFGSYVSGDVLFDFAIDMAKQQGLARVLAEPNLTTMSGQMAEFLSGGEFPIPVPDRDGTTIEYKEFGVGVKFVPTVLDSGRINLNLNVLVSELSNANAVGVIPEGSTTALVTPSITKRSANSTIELGDGQTIAIAGLLSSTVRESMDELPGLGEIPVLGQLFSSQEYRNGETELVILVTPRLVRPVDREKLVLPTDGFVDPTDLGFYLMGRLSKRDEDVQPNTNPNSASAETQSALPPTDGGGTQNKYGHSL
ncbi:type II and III secretion system protein family protein [Ferrimonas balearica]|uniref:type II and III secretion system protein family protein n=1 Tax=Ferrimonas balearica TaxID=44012 RepID=UPI001F282605|nr:type II and III secretion system protein family protein [Ferrimonas balearica]MBY6019794.1 type II and III secretion system protein family protein [Halomonas denitrificans]MBY6096861.1 type II and III secretion system protein family protein [Ferrimonas balearica]